MILLIEISVLGPQTISPNNTNKQHFRFSLKIIPKQKYMELTF